MLKGQDIVVLLALVGHEGESQTVLVGRLGWHAAGVHRSIGRLQDAGLFERSRRRVAVARAEEFLVHGAKYVFPASSGEMTRGLPTAWGAPPLVTEIASGADAPPVWPDAASEGWGHAFEPLHAIAVQAAKNDAQVYERLALVDAIRGGDARSRAIASKALAERLHG